MYRLTVVILALAASCYGASVGDRVVGGSDAPDGRYPYQVSLRVRGSHLCGGSIIADKLILTAAHCLSGYALLTSLLTVVVGTNKLNEGGDTYRVGRVISHPFFISNSGRNDIGLVRVVNPIVFGPKVQPIALPNEDFTKVNYPAVLSGWGKTSHPGPTPNELQHIVLNVIDQQTCLSFHDRTNSNNICTFTRAGEGACHGDSGGPLVADGVLIGVVSWGIPCAVGEPDVFTRVWSYRTWIDGYIALS